MKTKTRGCGCLVEVREDNDMERIIDPCDKHRPKWEGVQEWPDVRFPENYT